MLAAPSQLLLRNADRLPAGTLLLVNPPADGCLRELAARADLQASAFTQDYAVARALEAQRQRVQFAVAPAADAPPFDTIVVHHPKEKALTDFLLFLARSRLREGGSIWLVGENNGGIRATEKRLKQAGIAVVKLDSARHCQLLQVTPKTAGAPFVVEDWLEVLELEIGKDRLAVASLPGVFSSGYLDDGTALLLSTFASPIAGRVLDMGCGAGVIGACLKKRNPAITVEMVDNDAVAVLASEWTLRENGLSASVFPSDGFSAVKGTFDWIASNPPFHDGLSTDYRFIERFIADAPRFLRPGGRLRLVANAHLRYVPMIEEAFGNCRTLAENTRFRVYEAVRG